MSALPANRPARFFWAQPEHADTRNTGRPKKHLEEKPALARAMPRRCEIQLGVRVAVEKEIALDDGRNLIFYDEVRCLHWPDLGRILYSIPPFDAKWGRSVEEARQAAARAVWEEADKWLHTPSHKLSRDEIKRKGLVLGIVDVLKSKIAKRKRKTVSVLGQIERDPDGSAWFRESSTEGKRFAFDPELEKTLPSDNYFRMGKQRTGEFGKPIGPIVELGEPLDANPEETQAIWLELMDAHD